VVGIAVLENRKWAQVGMVVGDDVAVDAINELYSILHSSRNYI